MKKQISRKPRPAKPSSEAMKKAGKATTRDGLRETREPRPSREDIRQQNAQRQGHAK